MLASLVLFACGGVMAEREVACTLDEWKAINPVLEMYQPMPDHWAPAMGIHWGVPGLHMTIGVGHDDIVAVVEVIYPEAIGWHPWFDQPEGQPMELLSLGEVYTQHLCVVDPATLP